MLRPAYTFAFLQVVIVFRFVANALEST
jgi:hypothetical protein